MRILQQPWIGTFAETDVWTALFWTPKVSAPEPDHLLTRMATKKGSGNLQSTYRGRNGNHLDTCRSVPLMQVHIDQPVVIAAFNQAKNATKQRIFLTPPKSVSTSSIDQAPYCGYYLHQTHKATEWKMISDRVRQKDIFVPHCNLKILQIGPMWYFRPYRQNWTADYRQGHHGYPHHRNHPHLSMNVHVDLCRR